MRGPRQLSRGIENRDPQEVDQISGGGFVDFFAVLVLLYEAAESLPPRCSADMQRFAMVFTNAGEWRSKACSAYVDETSIDSASLLQESMEETDDEEEALLRL